MLLRALGVGRGDEIIVTGFTCTAVPVPVMECGAIPVYADIAPHTYHMDPRLVENLINSKTKALIIQHTYGIPAAVADLVALARSRGLVIIEDACLGLGSRHLGRPLGSFGDAAIFSFELSKMLTAGWGGIVQTNRSELGAIVRRYRVGAGSLPRCEASRRLLQAGLSFFLYHPALFPVTKYMLAALFKMQLFRYSTSVHETLGRLPHSALASPGDAHWRIIARQLKRLQNILDCSQSISERYRDVLRAHGWMQERPAGSNSNVRLIRFPLVVNNREKMLDYFAKNRIELGKWFDFPISPQPPRLEVFHYQRGQCPVAEEVCRHVVNLPLHSRLSSADVDHICGVLDRYLKENPDALISC